MKTTEMVKLEERLTQDRLSEYKKAIGDEVMNNQIVQFVDETIMEFNESTLESAYDFIRLAALRASESMQKKLYAMTDAEWLKFKCRAKKGLENQFHQDSFIVAKNNLDGNLSELDELLVLVKQRSGISRYRLAVFLSVLEKGHYTVKEKVIRQIELDSGDTDEDFIVSETMIEALSYIGMVLDEQTDQTWQKSMDNLIDCAEMMLELAIKATKDMIYLTN